MINILSTGIAGCGEKEYFEKFSQFCRQKGMLVNVINTTDVILAVARKTNHDVNKYNLLNFPKSTVDTWYQAALNQILKEKLIKNAINIVNTHATYWWKEGPDEVVSANLLNSFFKAFDPLFFIQVVDGIGLIKERLDRVVENVGRVLNMESILRWRDLESYVTKIFAQINHKEFYLIARAQGPDTLFRLIFDNRLKIYFSFPITFAEKRTKKKIDNFVKELGKIAIVFDPYKVEKFESFIAGMKKLGTDAIVKRDFQLIDQSDFVVAYFPKVVPSSGMITEMNYANSNGKIVYLVWPNKKYSPWTIYPVRKVFFSPEDCLRELKKVVKQRKKRNC
jgi:adenylate kinase